MKPYFYLKYKKLKLPPIGRPSNEKFQPTDVGIFPQET
ncbi:hypothetical protein KKC1_30800 [Calderihabitans maritimus]|uniref:Uncharacterized protein n=1 Tax=Calderihabitans maritimus TaxID=1246530 RepID=A0A1Z5HXG1_9FIRM|nr:hypothetical protein KKC1_30800 [Calderihabitans maritimus]